MREVKTKMQSKVISGKKHKSFLFCFIVFAVFVAACVALIGMQVEITQRSQRYDNLVKSVSELEAENAQLRRYSIDENRMEYIEQIARDQLDYSYPDETIYYFTPQ